MGPLAYCYLDKGDFAKALTYLQKYASQNPDDANPFDSMGDLYFVWGKLDKALDTYQRAMEMRPDFSFTSSKIAYIYALKEDYSPVCVWLDKDLETASSGSVRANLYWIRAFMEYLYGKKEDALQALDEADAITNRDNIRLTRGTDWLRAHIFFDLGEYGKAKELYRSYLKYSMVDFPSERETSLNNYYFFTGLIYCKLLQLDSARAYADRIRSQSLHPEKDYNYLYLQKEIQIATALTPAGLDSIAPLTAWTQTSLRWFTLIDNTPMPFVRNSLAEKYHHLGMSDKAIAEYQRLITFNPDSKDRCLINPRYHYYLGILYQEKGMKEKAIGQYRKFLDLWQDADPAFKEPADARQRLQALLK